MVALTVGDLLRNALNAKGDKSKLGRIVANADAFNTQFGSRELDALKKDQRLTALEMLERIAEGITLYAAWRSPFANGGGKTDRPRIKKWEQLDTLKNQVASNAKALGFKMLGAPTTLIGTTRGSDSALGHFNWLEWFKPPADGPTRSGAPRERGQELSTAFVEWLESEKAGRTSESFWSYLRSSDDQRSKQLGDVLYQQTEEHRWRHAEFKGGKWTEDDQPITENGEDLIIVVPPEMRNGHFLFARHEMKVVHHSSLAAGRPVRFAGMFQMVSGKFTRLYIKTGHYVLEEATAVRWLNKHTMMLGDIKVWDRRGPDPDKAGTMLNRKVDKSSLDPDGGYTSNEEG